MDELKIKKLKALSYDDFFEKYEIGRDGYVGFNIALDEMSENKNPKINVLGEHYTWDLSMSENIFSAVIASHIFLTNQTGPIPDWTQPIEDIQVKDGEVSINWRRENNET